MVDLIWKYKTIFGAIVLLFVIEGCTKAAPRLTPKTHEGRNTISYRMTTKTDDLIVGGEFYLRLDDFFMSKDSIQILDDLRNKGFYSAKTNVNSLYFSFKFDSLSGQMLFEESELIYGADFTNDLTYIMDTSRLNFAEITFVNNEKKIAAGLFEFNMIALDYGSTSDSVLVDSTKLIRIHDGRFDLKAND